MALRSDITLGALLKFRVTGPFGEGFPEDIDQDFPAMVLAIDEEKQKVHVRVFTTFRDFPGVIDFSLLQEPQPQPVSEPEPEPKPGDPRYLGPPIPPTPEEDVPPVVEPESLDDKVV